MHFHLAVLLRKHILLSTFAATFALAGCGSKGNASDGVATDPRGVHACQPAADSAALTDAMVAQCDDGRPKPPVYVPNLTGPAQGFPGRTCSVDHFTQNGSATSKKLDLLLVLDTTTRISHAWTELAEHLDRLTTRLDGVDLRIAIVLAHVDEQEGRLWAPGAEPRVLDLRKMSVREASARLKGYLWSAVNAFEDRGIGEAAFYSLHQLVTKHAEEARRQGFFRPDAGLAVLFQSDEQEIGANVPSPLPDGVRPRCDDDYPPVIQREFYRPQDLNASSVFAAVRALKGAMPVSMNAFVNVNSEDMEHYLPVFQHPSDGKLCVYASPGYGYFEMVAKTGGALRSVHEPAELKLDHLGVSLRDGLALQHDFPLSHPAREVDPVTIQSTVDGGLTPHTYSATTNIAHLDYAGRAGSKIDISYCQPQDQTNWSISGFAGQTTQTSATLSWQTTGAATTGVVRWGTSPNQLTQAVPDDGTGSSHSVTVTGLRPGTTYYFQAVATDDYGLSKTSPVISLSTQAPSLPSWTLTGFAGVGAQISVQLSFATSEYATTGKVLWGTSQRGLDHSTPADVSPVTAHSFTVSGLQPDTTYYFQAVASDDRGQTKQSAVIAVKTQAVPLPSWTLANFAGTSTRTSVTLSFATTEYATTGKVLWGTSQRGLDQSTPTDASPTTAHTFTVTGLNPNTTYYFQAVATDDRGQTKSSAVIAVKTQALPSWSIEGFAGVATQTSVTLSFTTSTYATTGKVLWGTSQGGLDQSTPADASATTSHSFAVTGLQPDTTYYFQATATDDAGQVKTSAVIAVKTQALPLPVWAIENFAGTSTITTVTLSFATSGYATKGKVLWGTSQRGLDQSTPSDSAPVTSHAFTVNGLTPNTTYFFQAVASDDRGQTKSSAVIAVTTQPLPLPVWSIAGFAGTGTRDAITVSFATSEYATTGKVLWGTSAGGLDQSTPADASPVNNHSFTISGLAPGTTYFFQAVASDDRGQTKSSAVIAVNTQALPAWSIANFAGTPTQTSVALSFATAGYATKGKVLWGSSQQGLDQSTPSDASPTTTHAFTVSGLQPGTTYFFQAVASDDASQTKFSPVISVTTLPAASWTVTGFDGTTTNSTASLIWNTGSVATKATVKVGLRAGDLSFLTVDVPSFATSHVQTVTGLSPGTTYFFQVVTTDGNGTSVSSNVISKTTKAR